MPSEHGLSDNSDGHDESTDHEQTDNPDETTYRKYALDGAEQTSIQTGDVRVSCLHREANGEIRRKDVIRDVAYEPLNALQVALSEE